MAAALAAAGVPVPVGVEPSPGTVLRGLSPDLFGALVDEALAADEFFLVFQPQAGTDDGALAGWEALLRWRLPDGTLVPPDLFVPLAEQGDAILRLGDWVLRCACFTAARWLRDGTAELPMAVNVSARQMEAPGFVRSVLAALTDSGLPADRLKLELTETALFRGGETARQAMLELRGAGVRLVLDDFGTGCSSLALLRRVPVEALKIDRQFVQAMVEDRDAAAIVQAVVALAHALGLTVIAEGVETREQWLFLRAYRCDRIQGYRLARPLPEADVPAFMAAHRAERPHAG